MDEHFPKFKNRLEMTTNVQKFAKKSQGIIQLFISNLLEINSHTNIPKQELEK